jgi:hypothetical protein
VLHNACDCHGLVIPGDLRQNESAQVSANLLGPGPVFLEPFGQKERRSAGDDSRSFFFLEIGPGKSPGVTLNPPMHRAMSPSVQLSRSASPFCSGV